MNCQHDLQIELHGFWHAGSGRSAGALADALVQKSADGLPVIGGRHIKGLLRHALVKAEALGWFAGVQLPAGPAQTLETLLFGSANQQEGRFATLPGMLIVSDAALPNNEADWLAMPEQAQLRQYLYTRLSSTAMTELGTAKENSLRAIEVSLPVQLLCCLQLTETAVDAEHRQQQRAWLQSTQPWQQLIEASSMIESLGASRSRGLGEARFIWQESKGGQQ